MLDPKSWLKQAQELRLDEQRRVRHDCGDGSPMVVFHKDEGWSAYCHRCGEPGFVARPAESLSERLARIKAREHVEANVQRSIVPPMPAVSDVTGWPAPARVWLYKAGLSNDDINLLGIYYNEKTDRVVIPILSEGTSGDLIYWQARDYAWSRASTRPKYLNPSAGGASMGVWFSHARPERKDRVLTEDYLSAYRIYRAGYNTCCLLGTKLSSSVLSRLLDTGGPCILWLDNDQGRRTNPGQEAAREIRQVLRGVGLSVLNIVSDKDPKSYSRKEIQSYVSGNHSS